MKGSVEYLNLLAESDTFKNSGAQKPQDFDVNLIQELVKINGAFSVFLAGQNLAKMPLDSVLRKLGIQRLALP